MRSDRQVGHRRVYPRRGKWAVDYIDPKSGRRIRRVISSDRKEAEAELQRLCPAESDARERTIGPGACIGQILHTWICDLDAATRLHPDSKRFRRPKTVETARMAERPLCAFFGAATDARKLTEQRIEAYIEHRLGEVSASTVRREIACLRASFRWAASPRRAYFIGTMPRFPMPELPSYSRERLTISDCERLMDAADDQRTRTLFAVCIFGGLRKGEALHLKLRDIRLLDDPPWLAISAKPEANWFPKTKKPREVPIHSRLAAELRAYLELRGSCEAGWLFVSRGARWATPDKHIRAAFKAAGIDRREKLHAFRAAWVTDLVTRQGVDLVTAAQLGGWSEGSGIQTIAKHYATSSRATLAEAIAKLGRKAS